MKTSGTSQGPPSAGAERERTQSALGRELAWRRAAERGLPSWFSHLEAATVSFGRVDNTIARDDTEHTGSRRASPSEQRRAPRAAGLAPASRSGDGDGLLAAIRGDRLCASGATGAPALPEHGSAPVGMSSGQGGFGQTGTGDGLDASPEHRTSSSRPTTLGVSMYSSEHLAATTAYGDQNIGRANVEREDSPAVRATPGARTQVIVQPRFEAARWVRLGETVPRGMPAEPYAKLEAGPGAIPDETGSVGLACSEALARPTSDEPTVSEPAGAPARPPSLPELERGMSSGASSDQPVRVHAGWSDDGLGVWIGIDTRYPEWVTGVLAPLLASLRETAAKQGMALASVVCNGRVIAADENPAREARQKWEEA